MQQSMWVGARLDRQASALAAAEVTTYPQGLGNMGKMGKWWHNGGKWRENRGEWGK